jgi:Domain of unknown function (DUF4145)
MRRHSEWQNVGNLPPRNFTCGYADCGRDVSSEKGWIHSVPNQGLDGVIHTCPVCKRPTFFDLQLNTQLPGVSMGNDVQNLPAEIQPIWSEIRNSTSQGSFTSAVLLGRKLLMHIAVDAGAKSGLAFTDYVDFLVDNHYAPPRSKDWIDKIRFHGNEANHEIVVKKKEDAEEIMVFLEMLLKFIYEFPARAGVQASVKPAAPQ